MPLHGQGQVVAAHAVPVIDDLDPLDAAAGQDHGDAGGAGVERVLDQLLDRGGWALDHLAGGDAVHQALGEAADSRHGAEYRFPGLDATERRWPGVSGPASLARRVRAG